MFLHVRVCLGEECKECNGCGVFVLEMINKYCSLLVILCKHVTLFVVVVVDVKIRTCQITKGW